MSRETPTVFIIDDDASVRESLQRLVMSLGFQVRAFADAHTFLNTDRGETRGCLLLDVGLPDLNGLEVQKHLIAVGSQLPIIFLTGQGDIPMSVSAMKAGAVEFLTKPFRSEQLVAAVRDALELERASWRERTQRAEMRRRYETLTPREKEVMAGVVAGMLNKQIAAELGKTEATVKEQRAHVMTKMQAGSVAELVRFAERLGLPTDGTPPR
jgi:FixJ family two-component response regulator